MAAESVAGCGARSRPSSFRREEGPVRYTIFDQRKGSSRAWCASLRAADQTMNRRILQLVGVWAMSLGALALVAGGRSLAADPQAAAAAADAPRSTERVLLNRYCVSCHNQRTKTAGLALDTL